MAVTGVLRPGYIQLRVLDLAEALVHYRDRLGLHEVSTGPDGRVYLKGFDEFDRHSVILREADEAGMDMMGFKVLDEATLIDFTRKLDTANVAVDHVEAGEQPGLGRRVGFTLASGHRIELYAQMELSDNGPETFNPNVWQAEPKGMAATRFDHALLYGPRIAEVTDLFCDVLGFRLAEKVDLGPGGLAVWLSCSNKAHDIAFVENADPGRFHHAAFFLETVNNVLHAGDIMAYYDIPIDIGPTRHGITRGYTIYFFDPSGNRNEVFSGGYSYYPDNPTREWHPEQLGKGIFYYERELNEAFLSVYT
jgi:catechol 2,3-dioxygenase